MAARAISQPTTHHLIVSEPTHRLRERRWVPRSDEQARLAERQRLRNPVDREANHRGPLALGLKRDQAQRLTTGWHDQGDRFRHVALGPRLESQELDGVLKAEICGLLLDTRKVIVPYEQQPRIGDRSDKLRHRADG